MVNKPIKCPLIHTYPTNLYMWNAKNRVLRIDETRQKKNSNLNIQHMPVEPRDNPTLC